VTSAAVLGDSREVFRAKARTFWWAAQLLPRDARDDAALVYAFCRLVDDTADDDRDTENARLALAALYNEVQGCVTARPLVAEFRAAAARLDLPLDSALELIEGARSDLNTVRVADDAELVRYCYRVASTVGLMMCAVLGVRRSEALPHAVDLGIAMQLTNICRDVAEDAANGRVYLPADRLARVGVHSEDLVRGRASAAGVAEVVRGTLELADRYYRSADGGMRDLPPRVRPAILVASRVYRAIGVRLRRRRCDALGGRTVVPWPEKLYWGTRAVAEALRPGMRGATPRWAHDATLHAALRGLPGANA
jgi:phytoene synthase